MGSFLIAHRASLTLVSGVLLSASIWMNLTRHGAWLNKALMVLAVLLAFSLSAGWIGVF